MSRVALIGYPIVGLFDWLLVRIAWKFFDTTIATLFTATVIVMYLNLGLRLFLREP